MPYDPNNAVALGAKDEWWRVAGNYVQYILFGMSCFALILLLLCGLVFALWHSTMILKLCFCGMCVVGFNLDSWIFANISKCIRCALEYLFGAIAIMIAFSGIIGYVALPLVLALLIPAVGSCLFFYSTVQSHLSEFQESPYQNILLGGIVTVVAVAFCALHIIPIWVMCLLLAGAAIVILDRADYLERKLMPIASSNPSMTNC